MLKQMHPKHNNLEPSWYGPYSVHSHLGLFTYCLMNIVTRNLLFPWMYHLQMGVMLWQDIDPEPLHNIE
jgi:hypothetical protein